MKMVAASVEKIGEDHGSITRRLESCCHMCIDLNVEEISSYEFFLPKKQTKMLLKLVQPLTHTLIYHVWTF